MMRLVAAFGHSMRGLGWALKHETAVIQEWAALMIGGPLAWVIAPDMLTFGLLLGALALLLAVELLNTAIEKLADVVTLDHHPQIGIVKDLGSAAVFVMLALNVVLWLAAAASYLAR